MDISVIAKQKVDWIAKDLDRLCQPEQPWAKREVLSRVIYVLACEAIALTALAYHTCGIIVKTLPMTVKWALSAVPISRINRIAEQIPAWLEVSSVMTDTFTRWTASLLVLGMVPGLVVGAHYAESTRRISQLLLPTPPTPLSRLQRVSEKIRPYLPPVVLIGLEVFSIFALIYHLKMQKRAIPVQYRFRRD